jgi:hypothetical protein
MRSLILVAFGTLAIACGPSKVGIEPSDVTRVDVRPASGQGLFCPGDAFQIELIARTKDGAACSSTDRKLGCKGKSDAVIDPSVVVVQAWPAEPTGKHDFTFKPDPDPLKTASTGLLLRGWIESNGKKSVEGTNTLKPVYACQAEHFFTWHQDLGYGDHGGRGPTVHVTVTTLSTPFYANAALVRMDAPELGITRYAISPSADKPVHIIAKGQDGARGFAGHSGYAGSRGFDSSSTCGHGGAGGSGGPGGPGGHGGDGGPGGEIHVHFDGAAGNALMGRVHVTNPGGNGGMGGYGGSGGPGGSGGSGGPSGKNCSGSSGPSGPRGPDGPMGMPGVNGPPGPPPTFDSGARATLFAKELSIIQQIEATPGAR